MRGHLPASANCNAPARSRTRGTSIGGLYVAATLQALLFMRSLWISLSHTLFASSARKSFDEFVGGLPLTSCIVLFVSHCQVTSNPGLCFTSLCQLGSIPRTALASFYREMLQEASGTSFKRACLDACFASPRFFFAMFRSSPPAMPY